MIKHCTNRHCFTLPLLTCIIVGRFCALGRYENWPQCWLWVVIPVSSSMVTTEEPELLGG